VTSRSLLQPLSKCGPIVIRNCLRISCAESSRCSLVRWMIATQQCGRSGAWCRSTSRKLRAQMLRLLRLVMEDFGPYKGSQEFLFPDGPGVTVVYGENRRGKTSLLNAIRYALLGVVVTRGSRYLDFHNVVNREARDEGREGFSVTLEFRFEDHFYSLVRRCEPRPGVESPRRNEDYFHSVYLRREAEPLSQADTVGELQRVMPPEIARFFLFDGELLAEYEELLRDKGESDVGPRISAAIEQILGLPVLQNAREDLRRLEEESAQQESRAAQRDTKTQRLGALLENLDAELQLHRSELTRHSDDLTAAQQQKAGLEQLLSKSARVEALLSERARLEAEIADVETQLQQKQVRLQEAMADAWREVLRERLVATKHELQERREEVQRSLAAYAVGVHRSRDLRAAIESGRCPVCAQDIDRSVLEADAGQLDGVGDVDVEACQEELGRLSRQLEVVERITTVSVGRTGELFDDVETGKVSLHRRLARREELLDEIADFNEEDYRTQRKEYESTVRRIAILQNGVDAEAKEVERVEAGIKEARAQLSRLGGATLAAERARRETFEALAGLFRDAIATYRDRLRDKVQKDATNLFLQLTSEPDDAGLRINEQYGLTIVHRDGSDIAVRSSGAEHVVALSLMGALQKNAPLRGPLIMDSLLIRIDDAHRANVVRALPTMAEQVVLMVFSAELRPREARERLDGALLAEFELVRRSARHTEISDLRG
jgi:DNA sulfur modification protein DndD